MDVVSIKVTFLIEFISSLFCADIFTWFSELTSCSLWFSNAPKHTKPIHFQLRIRNSRNCYLFTCFCLSYRIFDGYWIFRQRICISNPPTCDFVWQNLLSFFTFRFYISSTLFGISKLLSILSFNLCRMEISIQKYAIIFEWNKSAWNMYLILSFQ